jgi:hypothetical protein
VPPSGRFVQFFGYTASTDVAGAPEAQRESICGSVVMVDFVIPVSDAWGILTLQHHRTGKPNQADNHQPTTRTSQCGLNIRGCVKPRSAQ